MLFMGEEWGGDHPVAVLHQPPRAGAGRGRATGRRREFAAHGWAEADVPDPQDPATFARSKLDWAELDGKPHAEMLELYRRLIALRRQPAGPVRPAAGPGRGRVRRGGALAGVPAAGCAWR